jgi:Carbohydrate phosphorylase
MTAITPAVATAIATPREALVDDALGMDAGAIKHSVLAHLQYTLAELPRHIDSEWSPIWRSRWPCATGSSSAGSKPRTPTTSRVRTSQHDAWEHYRSDAELRRVLDMIRTGAFSPDAPDLFAPIVRALLDGGDPFLVLADYRQYVACQERVARAYRDQAAWTRMSIINTARMGQFSSDRTVRQYAEEIWGLTPVSAH